MDFMDPWIINWVMSWLTMHHKDVLSPLLPWHCQFNLKRPADIEKSQYMYHHNKFKFHFYICTCSRSTLRQGSTLPNDKDFFQDEIKICRLQKYVTQKLEFVFGKLKTNIFSFIVNS